jgi:hypothetical protein
MMHMKLRTTYEEGRREGEGEPLKTEDIRDDDVEATTNLFNQAD